MVPEPMLTKPATDDMNTTLPAPDPFKSGCAIWHKWYVDSKLVLMTLEYSSKVYSVVGFLMFVPTLFT